MSSGLECQSALQLSKCHVKLKVEFWRVQLTTCYYFIIFNRRVLHIFLLGTHVDFQRMIYWSALLLGAGVVVVCAHLGWSLKGHLGRRGGMSLRKDNHSAQMYKQISTGLCKIRAKLNLRCALITSLPSVTGSTWEKTFRQIGFER